MLKLYHTQEFLQLNHTMNQMSTAFQKLKLIFVARETSWIEKIELIGTIGIIFSIFFPIRYVLQNHLSTLLGYYSDFTAISLYLSFFLVLILIVIQVYKDINKGEQKLFYLKILLGLVLGIILYQLNVNPELREISFYHFLRICCVLLLGYHVYKSDIWLKYKGLLLWIFILMASIQSVIAITQFLLQHSLGINILGESPITISTYGVAKIVSHGTTFIRGYGTLPHPNILSAILVISSILNLHLLNNSIHKYQKIVLSVSFFLITMGVFVSFSRAGLLAYVVGLTTWWIITYFRTKSVSFIKKIWIIPLSIIISGLIFMPWLISRSTIVDQASVERSAYNKAGLEILKNNWVIGTGPGTNLFHMKQKLKNQLEEWNIQPIHNYWLITLAEWGIIGLFMVVFLVYTFFKFSKALIQNLFGFSPRGEKITCWQVSIYSIFLVFLILSCFDHYFYTIWSTQLILWIFIGLIWQSIVPRET